MKQDNIIKIFLISLITLILLSIFGFTYAYFSLEIEGTPKDIVMTTGDLRLEYKDETELKLDGAFPGDTVSKIVTVKNVGTKNVAYTLYWGDLINTVENFELHVTLSCKSYTNYGETTQAENGTCDNIYRAVPISDTVTTGTIKGNISIDPQITHEYTVTIKFDDKNYDQNYNKNKSFKGKIGIQEYIAPAVTNCTFDGELVRGAEYVNGQYTYRYKQSATSSSWSSMNNDGWGVQLTDKTSTDPVTSKVCTYINDKPVISMSNMFANSQAASIDLSSFDTSNVKNMSGMFFESRATSLDLSKFNTSKVTNMSNMFYNSNAIAIDVSNFNTSKVTTMAGMFSSCTALTTLDVSNFDTSKVTKMGSMFSSCKATTIDVSNFDTSKVTDMSNMFTLTQAVTIDVSNFNTSKVTDMYGMFRSSQVAVIDASNFDTSNVTNMGGMFYESRAKEIKGLNNFDTSNVTNMNGMFRSSPASSLDLSSFDTSNVTNMGSMFRSCKATTIDVSNFDTSKVTDMSWMFYGTKAEKLDLSSFNTSNVTNMSDMFGLSKVVTLKGLEIFNTSNVTNMSNMFEFANLTTLDLSSFDTSKVTNMKRMFYAMSKLKSIYVSDKFITDNVTSSDYMFDSTGNLVGGNGTKYNSSYVDKTYARIDTESTPGYFTAKQ